MRKEGIQPQRYGGCAPTGPALLAPNWVPNSSRDADGFGAQAESRPECPPRSVPAPSYRPAAQPQRHSPRARPAQRPRRGRGATGPAGPLPAAAQARSPRPAGVSRLLPEAPRGASCPPASGPGSGHRRGRARARAASGDPGGGHSERPGAREAGPGRGLACPPSSAPPSAGDIPAAGRDLPLGLPSAACQAPDPPATPLPPPGQGSLLGPFYR